MALPDIWRLFALFLRFQHEVVSQFTQSKVLSLNCQTNTVFRCQNGQKSCMGVFIAVYTIHDPIIHSNPKKELEKLIGYLTIASGVSCFALFVSLCILQPDPYMLFMWAYTWTFFL